MTNPQGQRALFLPGLNQELNDSGEPLKLSIGILDQAIIEACSNWALDKPLFDYLLPCWKRSVKAAATAKNVSSTRQELLEEAKRLCMSNCLFALTMPALYGLVHGYMWRAARIVLGLTVCSRDPNPQHDTLVPYLLKGIQDDGGLCFEFIKEATKRFDEDEAFPALFSEAMVKISALLRPLSLEDDYKPYVQVGSFNLQRMRMRQLISPT
jgi:ubiquitin conjugation factor E4 B